MTPQEMFNNALFGVRGQKYVRSYRLESGTCRYHGPSGLKCHIGHSIRNEDYRPSMEGHYADYAEIHVLFPDIDGDFLCELQTVHDSGLVLGAGEYERSMHQFAEAHNLEDKEP
jgi:hypothetical protein